MFDSDDDSTLFDLFAASDFADKYLSAVDIAIRNAALMSATLDVYAILPNDAATAPAPQ